MPAASAIRASATLSRQLACQRSGTIVTARPDEQFAPNRPILRRCRCTCPRVRASTGRSLVSTVVLQRPGPKPIFLRWPFRSASEDRRDRLPKTLARHDESTRGDRRTGSERKNRCGAGAGSSARTPLPRYRRDVPRRRVSRAAQRRRSRQRAGDSLVPRPAPDPARRRRAASAGYRVEIDGVDTGTKLFDPEVSSAVSTVAALPGVRTALVAEQRAIAREGPVVMAGPRHRHGRAARRALQVLSHGVGRRASRPPGQRIRRARPRRRASTRCASRSSSATGSMKTGPPRRCARPTTR